MLLAAIITLIFNHCDLEGNLDKIVNIESKWQIELAEKYPHLIVLGQTSGYCGEPGTESCVTFEVYLRCELETYSDSTLESYYQDLSQALSEGRNKEEERYTQVYQNMGYSSLEETEQKSVNRAS